MKEQSILEVIVHAISEKKGENILVYDMGQVSPFVSNAVIASAGNLRQVHAIAHNVVDAIKEQGFTLSHVEGDAQSRWVLVDAKDVVVHVFLDEERDVYQLEKLYCDIPMIHYDL